MAAENDLAEFRQNFSSFAIFSSKKSETAFKLCVWGEREVTLSPSTVAQGSVHLFLASQKWGSISLRNAAHEGLSKCIWTVKKMRRGFVFVACIAKVTDQLGSSKSCLMHYFNRCSSSPSGSGKHTETILAWRKAKTKAMSQARHTSTAQAARRLSAHRIKNR